MPSLTRDQVEDRGAVSPVLVVAGARAAPCAPRVADAAWCALRRHATLLRVAASS